MATREEAAGLIRLQSEQCTFTFERAQPGVMLITISGYDKGDFNTAPLDEIVAEMQRHAP